MKSVHLVIPDLFLPKEIAAEVGAGLDLPALEKILARAQPEPLQTDMLEDWLCAAFGVTEQAIAPLALRADGMDPGSAYWLRADPVHLRLQRDQMLLQTEISLTAEEAAQFCATLNAHFSGSGMRFFAPHSQRWYLQLDRVPHMVTQPVSQVAGRNVHAHLPQGPDALRWHGVFNEIQMLFHEHALNQAREARGELPVNSVWLWGGGRVPGQLAQPFVKIYGDSHLLASFAHAAGVSYAVIPDAGLSEFEQGSVLLVWEGLQRAIQYGDLQAWRTALQRFEQYYAVPLLAALRAGNLTHIVLDVLSGGVGRRFVLTRGMTWRLWRRRQRLAHYT